MSNRSRVALLIATGLLGTLTMALPGYADPVGTCQDGFTPVPAPLVVNGEAKDKNGNGVVCGKLGPDGKFHGGPDDSDLIDDIL